MTLTLPFTPLMIPCTSLQSKLLALDLVQDLLDNAGPAFRSGPRFIAAIKHYLCMGLTKNILSSISPVASTSLKVRVSHTTLIDTCVYVSCLYRCS